MDNRGDNFAGGFLAGALFGGMVGGVLGALFVSRPIEADYEQLPNSTERRLRRRKRQLHTATDVSIEEARQGLETKIAQLNDAIDDVRRQLSNVNGNGQESGE